MILISCPCRQGRSFLFVASVLKGNAVDRTWIHDLNTGQHQLLGGADGQFPTYSRSGYLLYQRMQSGVQLWGVPFSLKTLKITGEPFPVADSNFVFGVSNNDTLVYLDRSAPMRQLTARDRSGRKAAVIGAPAQDLWSPVLSPDTTRVAFSAAEGITRNVWIAELDRPVKTPITFARGESRDSTFFDAPAWSPAGDRVAYRMGNQELWAIRSKSADGSGAEVDLVTGPEYIIPSQWYKPDRMLITRWDRQSGQASLDFVSLASRTEADTRKPNLPYSEQNPRVSPDGNLLAFASTQSGRTEIYVRPLNQTAGGKQVSEEGGNQPRWRRDGKELFYVEGNSVMAASVSSSANSVTFGKPQLLFTIEGGMSWGYDVWPDGQRFLIPEPVQGSKPPSIRVVQNWSAAFGSKRKE